MSIKGVQLSSAGAPAPLPLTHVPAQAPSWTPAFCWAIPIIHITELHHLDFHPWPTYGCEACSLCHSYFPHLQRLEPPPFL